MTRVVGFYADPSQPAHIEKKKLTNKIIVYRVTTIISPNLDQILSYLAHTLFSVCTPRKMFRCHTKRKS